MRQFSALLWVIVAILTMIGVSGCLVDFSPDGKQLVLIYSAPDPDTAHHSMPSKFNRMAIIGVDGSGIQNLPVDVSDSLLAWSPDGKYIAYVSAQPKDQLPSLRVFELSTQSYRNIETRKRMPLVYSWRNDGKELAVIEAFDSDESERALGNQTSFEAVWYQWPSAQVVRRLPLSVNGQTLFGSPQRPLWVPNSEDIFILGSITSASNHNAKNDQKRWNVFQSSVSGWKQLTASDDVIGMGLSLSQNKLLWGRYNRSAKTPQLLWYSRQLLTNDVVRIPFAETPNFSASNYRKAEQPIIAFSPDGHKLAICAVLNAGKDDKTHLPKRYFSCEVVSSDDTKGVLAYQSNSFLYNYDDYFLDGPQLSPVWSPDSTNLALIEKALNHQTFYIWSQSSGLHLLWPLGKSTP